MIVPMTPPMEVTLSPFLSAASICWCLVSCFLRERLDQNNSSSSTPSMTGSR